MEHSRNRDTSMTVAVVEAVSSFGGCEPTALPPLYHAVDTDGNGYADATHATMPILSGGATRSEDKLVMPVWWLSGIGGGYYEMEQYAGEVYKGFNNGGGFNMAYVNLYETHDDEQGIFDVRKGPGTGYWDGTGYRNTVTNSGADGEIIAAQNSDDARNSTEMNSNPRLWVNPDKNPNDLAGGATYILRRMYLWPYELTEGDSGQLKALFDHDFSV